MSAHAVENLQAGSRLHAACACASSARFTLGSTERKYERSREFAVTHLALDLEVDMKQKGISGTATLDFIRRAPSGKNLRLDGLGLSIKKVELSSGKGKSKLLSSDEYSYDGDELVVPLGSSIKSGSLIVTYSATPRLGLYFLAPDKKVPTRPHQVWSQCQDEDGKHWFPCQDKPHVKMTYELKARVPKGNTVLSGGELLGEKRPKSGAWEFHYRLDEPTPAYLITLVVGKFDEWTETMTLPSGRKLPLRYLVPPGTKADGKRAFARTADAIRVFSEKTGIEYPFQRYSQVVVADFIFGGMENTTATTMYEHILIDKTASLDIVSHDLVAHELAHQWFGDLVTCRDWSHAWLNEGFATYFEHVEREDRLDNDEYEHNVTVDLNQYLGEARGSYKRPIVCRDYDEPIDLFDRHLYQKGGLVLHMLRRRLGDDIFWQAVNSYLSQHRGGIVETNDLMRAFEEASGVSLEKFFDQWVYRPGHVELRATVAFDNGVLTVDVEQTQKGDQVAVFELPFEIEVSVGGKTEVHTRLINERKSSLVVKTSKRPDWVAVDPEYKITGPITLNAPTDLLRSLLKSGTRARARRMAAMSLGRRQDEQNIQALIDCLKNKKERWMVRAKAADSLGRIRGDQATAALVAAAKTEDHKVRRAVVESLGNLRDADVATTLIAATKDKSYLVTAAAARALGKCPDRRNTATLKNLLKKDSWSEVVRAGALGGLAMTGDDEAVPTLMEWTNYGKPLRARRAALAALPQLGEGKKVREHLERMLHDRDPHVRSAVLSALSSLGDSKATGAIHELLARELDGGVRTEAKSVLVDLGKSGDGGVKEVRKENQRLEREVATLKTRLSKLEQLMKDKAKSERKSSASSSTKVAKKAAKKATKKTAKKSRR